MSARFTKTVYSAVQSSGRLHVGNYVGAVRRWTDLQRQSDARLVFAVADLHALTSGKQMAPTAPLETARMLLACGVDPERAILYRQSALGGLHTQLSWVLSCVCPPPLLKRMVHYKDKARLKQDSLALFSYPVLQAADVLLFQATHVPVGEDQRQHLELARDLAKAFNERFQSSLLPRCRADIGVAPRLMSLRDETKKMSKSDASLKSCIFLDDSPEAIRDKIRRAKTDSESGIAYDDAARPALANLLRLYGGFSQEDPHEVANQYARRDKADFKTALADLLVAELAPMRTYIETTSLHEVEHVLQEGADRARDIAVPVWNQVAQAVGLQKV